MLFVVVGYFGTWREVRPALSAVASLPDSHQALPFPLRHPSYSSCILKYTSIGSDMLLRFSWAGRGDYLKFWNGRAAQEIGHLLFEVIGGVGSRKRNQAGTQVRWIIGRDEPTTVL